MIRSSIHSVPLVLNGLGVRPKVSFSPEVGSTIYVGAAMARDLVSKEIKVLEIYSSKNN